MLVIRDEQMQALREPALRKLEERLLGHVEREHPQKLRAWGAERTRAFLRRAILSGTRARIETQAGLAALADLMLEFGERFELSPDRAWALETLAHPTLPTALKLELIQERLTERFRGRTVVSADERD